jgi:hypothetical protein
MALAEVRRRSFENERVDRADGQEKGEYRRRQKW